MAGMNTTGTPKKSEYDDRTVEIEVTGVCRQDVMRTGNFTMKVTHSRMVEAMQNINRLGGKVSKVTTAPST
ncbi:MAG: rod-capping linker protein [Hormoscilla sp. SP5CHS1]|nr:rod-capping linker protein [Hormoscilla sp. SP12CHS1]MBC6455402.1 rod-capping linker protein [Hormoscilla sp. SP5CHS1]MBC6473351.1 rod-capping linker protein [Hormoscilla sp. GM102CHS1]